MLTLRIARGKCLPLGASALPDGVNFALLCGNGTAVSLVIYPVDGEQPIAEIGLRPWRPFRLRCSSPKADKNGSHRGVFGLVQQDKLLTADCSPFAHALCGFLPGADPVPQTWHRGSWEPPSTLPA